MLDEGEIPNSWRKVHITLIYKEKMDPKEIKNYRMIYLLHVDYKIFASILTSRLRRVLAQMIHQDQAGFLPKRQMKRNVRIIMDTLEYYERQMEKQLALIFLVAQKAFDNVNWQFMMALLEDIQTGEVFIGLVKAI